MVPDTSRLDGLRRSVGRVRPPLAVARDRLDDHPMAVAAGLAALLLGVTAYRTFAPLPTGTWPGLKDAVIFEYAGWYLAEGNRMYVDLWGVKPPLAFELPVLLALLAGDSVVGYHVLNVLATCAAIVLAAAATAGIVRELTDDSLAAVVAGVAMFALPYYAFRALVGFKAKYFVVAAGLWCLYLAYRERPLASGVAGAVAVGCWQLAAVFPLAGFGLLWQSDGRNGTTRFLAGVAGASVVILGPVVMWGAVPAMVAEVVLAPLLVTESANLVDRLLYVVRVGWKASPVVLLGLAGLARGLRSGGDRRRWPLGLVLAWFTVQVLVLDFDNAPDLFPWLAVVAVGVGVAVAAVGPTHRADASGGSRTPSARIRARRGLAGVMLGLAVLSVATMGGYGVVESGLLDHPTYDTGTELDPDVGAARTYNATERQYVYWNRVEVPTCRAFGANTQFRLVKNAGHAPDRPWYEAPCGRFDPLWRALRSSDSPSG